MICATCFAVAQQAPVAKQSVIGVRGPTVIAFFRPLTKAQENDIDSNEALNDFEYFASNVKQPLTKLGVNFHVIYAHSFRLRQGSQIKTFRPAEPGIGYYLVAPGKKAQVEYSVMTDSDLIEVAEEYFGLKKE